MELFNLHIQQGRDLCAKLSSVASVIKTPATQLQSQLAIEVRVAPTETARGAREPHDHESSRQLTRAVCHARRVSFAWQVVSPILANSQNPLPIS